jgi:hypothetical protein
MYRNKVHSPGKCDQQRVIPVLLSEPPSSLHFTLTSDGKVSSVSQLVGLHRKPLEVVSKCVVLSPRRALRTILGGECYELVEHYFERIGEVLPRFEEIEEWRVNPSLRLRRLRGI